MKWQVAVGVVAAAAAGACEAASPTDPTARQRAAFVESIAVTELTTLVTSRPHNRIQPLISIGLPTPGFISPSFLGCRADSTGIATSNSTGVPQDLTLTWPAGRCLQVTGGTVSQTFSGTIRIQDLGGRYATRVSYANVESTLSGLGAGSRSTLDGIVESRALDATNGRLLLQTRDRQETGTPSSANIVHRARDVMVDYSDAAGVPRPVSAATAPGPVTFSGTMAIVVSSPLGTDSVHLRISTGVPLQPDLTCILSGYRAGEVSAVVTGAIRTTLTTRYSCR